MKVTVIPARELPTEHAALWSRIQEENPDLASPYFSPLFTVAVASVRPDVWVGVLADGDRPFGFFPFQRTFTGIGKPVGGQLSDYQGVIAPKNCDWDAKQLVSECGLKAWDFDHLLASQKPFEQYHRGRTISPFLDLSKGYQAYVDERKAAGTNLFWKTRLKEGKLEREVGPIRFETHDRHVETLHTLLKWKSEQYIASNITDVFAFRWTVQLLETIHATQTESFAGVLSTLWAGDQLVAAHMGMRSRNIWHHWFPAYDSRFAKYSPGIILLLKMAEHAEALGVRAIDQGKGMSEYKQRQMSGSVDIAEGTVETSCVVTRARRAWSCLERWARRSRLAPLMRIPGRLMLRAGRWGRFR